MKTFRKVINGHTYHVTCSHRFAWVTVTLYEDGVAVVRKRKPATGIMSNSFFLRSVVEGECLTKTISFEGVTAEINFDKDDCAASCEWSTDD